MLETYHFFDGKKGIGGDLSLRLSLEHDYSGTLDEP